MLRNCATLRFSHAITAQNALTKERRRRIAGVAGLARGAQDKPRENNCMVNLEFRQLNGRYQREVI